jgi:hypothetical protein
VKNFYITQTLTIEGGGEDAVELEVETEVEVDYHIELAQRGGMTDPSWPAHAVLEAATRVQDLVIGGVTVARSGDTVEIPEDQREGIEGEITEYLGEP